jgi:hypothetical protein
MNLKDKLVKSKAALLTAALCGTITVSDGLFNKAQATGQGWKSSEQTCTYIVTVTYGGGPVPFSISHQETKTGTKRVCTDGWGLCAWGSACS